jgi:hypothetical protein
VPEGCGRSILNHITIIVALPLANQAFSGHLPPLFGFIIIIVSPSSQFEPPPKDPSIHHFPYSNFVSFSTLPMGKKCKAAKHTREDDGTMLFVRLLALIPTLKII